MDLEELNWSEELMGKIRSKKESELRCNFLGGVVPKIVYSEKGSLDVVTKQMLKVCRIKQTR